MSQEAALFTTYATNAIRLAAKEQDLIGWFATTEGRISTAWRAIQESHFLHTGSRHTANNWAAGVVVEGILEWTH